MDFALNEEQSLLKDTVRRLLDDHYGFDRRAKYMASRDGFSRDMWERYAKLGLLALPFSPEQGGIAAGPVETMVVMEEFGRSLTLEPYLETVILSGGVLRRSASSPWRDEVLAAIAEGSMLVSLAHEEGGRPGLQDRIGTCATRLGDSYRLDGRKHLVIGAPSADRLIVSARMEPSSPETMLFIVDARGQGVGMHAFRTHDGAGAANVTLDGVMVDAGSAIMSDMDPLVLLERARDEATAALCAEATGAMSEAFSMTVEYLRTRQQFGVAIGTFQSLRHQAADMYVALEHARSMSILAMMDCPSDDRLQRRRSVSAAKIQVGRAGRLIGQRAIQLHGAIGMTDELKVGHLFKRLEVIGRRFGDADHHIELLSQCGGVMG